MEEHVPPFKENKVNLQSLRILKEKDLKSMGVSGEQCKKLLQFIEKYKNFSSVEGKKKI